MVDRLDIEALESQMNDEVGEIVKLQKEFLAQAEQIEAKKEHVNKLDGAIWALKMERGDEESQNSNGVSTMGEEADK